MLKFKIGDRVVKGKTEVRDSAEIAEGRGGKVVAVIGGGDNRIKVLWDSHANRLPLYWWINTQCIHLETLLTKEERIVNKIKYLDKNFKDKKHVRV